MRGEGRAGEDKSSSLTGLNLIYPGLLVFYVEVAQLPHLSKQHCPLNIWRYVGWVDKYKYSVSEANIQITLLIVRRGALSTPIQTWANTDQLQGCEEDLNDFCRLLNNLTAKEGLGLTQVGFKQYEGLESSNLSSWVLGTSHPGPCLQVKVVHLIHNMRATLLPSWHYRAVDPPLRSEMFFSTELNMH